MSYVKTLVAAVCVALPALVGCATPNLHFDRAREEYAHSDFFQAWQSIQLAREQAPDDPDVRAAYEKIRIAWLLKDAQQRIFQGDEVGGLENLERVLVLDADNPIALRLKDRARLKLAEAAAEQGDRLRSGGDLEGALAKYDEALRLTPGLGLAEEGKSAVQDVWRRLRSDAREHYLEGVRALAERLFLQTRYHMGLALEKDPTMQEAREPVEMASRLLAQERYAKAKDMEERGFWKPALREYREIASAYPDFEGLEARIGAMEAEVEAEDLATKGSTAAFRGQFRDARDFLEQAMQVTARQRDEISETLLFVHEREIEQRYTLAKDEELQGRLETALEAYRLIDREAPGFLDVRTRIQDLQIQIDEGVKAYDAAVKAEQAGDIERAIEHLTDVMLYWPSYRDAKQRLQALRDARRS